MEKIIRFFIGLCLLLGLFACEDLNNPNQNERESSLLDTVSDTSSEHTHPNANEADYAQIPDSKVRTIKPLVISGVPQAALPDDIVNLAIAEMPNQDNLQLLGQRIDSSWHHLAIFPEHFYYNYNKIMEVAFENDYIKFCSQEPFKATIVCGLFEWNPTLRRLRLESDYSEDQSELLLIEARRLAQEWKFKESIAVYDRILYPQAYFDASSEAIRLIEAAHSKAFYLYQQGDFIEAADMLDAIFDFWGANFLLEVEGRASLEEKLKNYPQFTVSRWLQIMTDYGLFLLKAKKYERAITVNNLVVRVAPDIPNAYLQLGDAYFDIGQMEAGRAAYRNYKKHMQRLDRKVPERVEIRIE
ncbi:MAG: hypothetical protein JJT94_00085 [Bernardetiaceae bacterium]|nr:hypothetical protein [Bernardetiaceae bacterium]